ncbi:PREDICTED: uncharacterized protein C12orf42-like, partial [Chrysochloris asiatica]|uniref:Uncharacterized protein C12orf42-like n=1 Tax=Chrysochloris asiatica TaxID=185453 RepID=A0A9B0UC05_CHRAS
SPERTQNPLAYKTLLCTRRYLFPRSPPVCTTSYEEDSYSTTSGESSEAPLISAVNQEMKKTVRRAPKQAWNSPFLESQMTKKPTRPHSADPVHLEATGKHIDIQARLPNRSSSISDKYPILYGPSGRPFTAIGLCRGSQTPSPRNRASRSFSEHDLEHRMVTKQDTLKNPDFSNGHLGTPGNPTRRCTVTMTPEMLPKHPHFPGEKGPRTDTSLQGNLAGAPIPRLAPASTHLSSERLIKVCPSPHSRPPRRFHKACSQAPPWPGVNAHLH